MSVPRLDALFHRPRPVRVVLQKFFVVISFDYERLHFSQAFDDQLCHVTEVGDKPEAARAGVKHEPEGINRVVRHGERLHGDIADRKLSASLKQSPIPTSFRETAGPKRLGREPVAINRQIEFMAENFKTADVIGVFVRENDAVELLRRDATLLQTQHHLPRAQTAINENIAMLGGDQRAIPGAPAAEHGQAEHGSQDSRVISSCANEIVTRTILSASFSMSTFCTATDSAPAARHTSPHSLFSMFFGLATPAISNIKRACSC